MRKHTPLFGRLDGPSITLSHAVSHPQVYLYVCRIFLWAARCTGTVTLQVLEDCLFLIVRTDTRIVGTDGQCVRPNDKKQTVYKDLEGDWLFDRGASKVDPDGYVCGQRAQSLLADGQQHHQGGAQGQCAGWLHSVG